MKFPGHIVAWAASRLFLPLMFMLGLALLAKQPAGSGVGFVAGLCVALAAVAHALVFGGSAARAAAPPPVWRLLFCVGLAVAAVGIGAQGLNWARFLQEAGLFTVTASGAALALTLLISRAPTLRDE